MAPGGRQMHRGGAGPGASSPSRALGAAKLRTVPPGVAPAGGRQHMFTDLAGPKRVKADFGAELHCPVPAQKTSIISIARAPCLPAKNPTESSANSRSGASSVPSGMRNPGICFVNRAPSAAMMSRKARTATEHPCVNEASISKNRVMNPLRHTARSRSCMRAHRCRTKGAWCILAWPVS
jgi:hypothetical protein